MVELEQRSASFAACKRRMDTRMETRFLLPYSNGIVLSGAVLQRVA